MNSHIVKPLLKPERPYFSSGPCVKPKPWSLEVLNQALLGRSHRSTEGIDRIRYSVDLMREVLEIPPSYEVALISGSATGAVEALLWNLLGPRPVSVYVYDVFSQKWADNIVQQLKISDTSVYENITDLDHADFSHDLVITWNGSTSGLCLPYDLWQNQTRQGLIICDATSAVFTAPLPWPLLDATAFSWQKGLGSEASQGVIALSPAALKRLKTYIPSWPIPSLMRLTHKGQINTGVFEGITLNTPSLMILEDAIFALKWAKDLGGLNALHHRTQQNYKIVKEWVERTAWIEFSVSNPRFRSLNTLCLEFQKNVEWAWITDFCQILAKEHVAYDIKNHVQARVPSLRIWTGPTVEPNDLQALLPWLEWAYYNS